MATFIYTAKNTSGETYEKSVEAPDRFAVYSIVRKEGGTIVSIREAPAHGAFLSHMNIRLFKHVKEIEKIVLARNVATMLKAGLTLSRALDVMMRQTTNQTMKDILQDVNQSVTKGAAFHEAIEKHPKVFSKLFVSMAAAGDESGKLSEALLVVASQLERAYTLKRKIRGALIYPSIIVIAMIGIGILMLMFVVPTLTATFAEFDVELPTSTKMVIAASDIFAHHAILAFSVILGIIVGFVAAMRTKRGKRAFEFVLLRIPLINTIVKETNAARTTRTLASLLSAGVGVIEALRITRDVLQNSYYKDVLDEAGEMTKVGKPIAEAFMSHVELYPVLVGDMMSVGGDTGKMTTMLEEIAVFYEGEVEQKTKDLSTVIEPFLMVFIGSVVGFFAVSMIAPIYSISEGI